MWRHRGTDNTISNSSQYTSIINGNSNTIDLYSDTYPKTYIGYDCNLKDKYDNPNIFSVRPKMVNSMPNLKNALSISVDTSNNEIYLWLGETLCCSGNYV